MSGFPTLPTTRLMSGVLVLSDGSDNKAPPMNIELREEIAITESSSLGLDRRPPVSKVNIHAKA